MKKIILWSLIVSLMLFSLCTDTKESSKPTIPESSTTPATEDRCTSFSCAGNVQTREENDGTNIAFCEGAESARIKCDLGEVSYMTLDESTKVYSMCCLREGAEMPA